MIYKQYTRTLYHIRHIKRKMTSEIKSIIDSIIFKAVRISETKKITAAIVEALKKQKEPDVLIVRVKDINGIELFFKLKAELGKAKYK